MEEKELVRLLVVETDVEANFFKGTLEENGIHAMVKGLGDSAFGAALDGPDMSIGRVTRGADVLEAAESESPDLIILDLQIGNMGGMASCLLLRMEQEAGRLPDSRILMLLDREADTFLAKRSKADGWLLKPLDAFRIAKAADALLAGETFAEGP